MGGFSSEEKLHGTDIISSTRAPYPRVDVYALRALLKHA
jgi:hypothetical protein